jgi:hypothetical protein
MPLLPAAAAVASDDDDDHFISAPPLETSIDHAVGQLLVSPVNASGIIRENNNNNDILWWGQLVTSPLWAQELSFKHLLEIARTHIDRQQASFLPKRVSEFCFPIVAMPSQLDSQPFGMPLSLYNTGWPGDRSRCHQR